jgi:DNA-directed RNA polymerase subunit RPC12/RpoP
MAESEPKEVTISGNKLACPICKNERFRKRSTLIKTVGMYDIGLDWLNMKATAYICSKCHHVTLFTSPDGGADVLSESVTQPLRPPPPSRKR